MMNGRLLLGHSGHIWLVFSSGGREEKKAECGPAVCFYATLLLLCKVQVHLSTINHLLPPFSVISDVT